MTVDMFTKIRIKPVWDEPPRQHGQAKQSEEYIEADADRPPAEQRGFFGVR